MNFGPILVAILARIGTTLFSERVILNLIVVLASWAVDRYGNDLVRELFEPLKDALDKRGGQPGNLYRAVDTR